MKIWTYMSTPFALGGREKPIATEADSLEKWTVEGVTLHLFQNPLTSLYHIAEEKCGAFIGHGATPAEALALVLDDLAKADPDLVKQQIAQHMREGDRAQMLEPDTFWRKFRNPKPAMEDTL